MQTEIIISGFGGQGVLFAGQLLAYASMDSGKEVTWFPSYGPEMRGGTAGCTVVISDEEIGAPVVINPLAAVVMNLPSLVKYESTVRAGGVLVINSSMVDRPPARSDIKNVLIPGSKIAETIGHNRYINMVMLGGLLANLPILTLESIEESIERHLPKRYHKTIPLNIKALREGATYKLN
jgi:2-oxoglutarate ferredoxin oxidoreductase subunit gamma